MIKLNENQQKAIKSKHPNIIVVAGSGSGKTKTLTERINYLIEKGEDPKGIVAITFTNLASYEMSNRVKEKDSGVFIGTMHSYANRYLKGLKIDTSKYISTENFKDLIIKAGDVCLKTPPKIKHLLIDEFQDLCDYEFNFIMNLNAENEFFIGDENQSIYGFKGARSDLFVNLCENLEYEVHFLPENYRSTADIILFGESLLPPGSLKNTKIMRSARTNIQKTHWQDALNKIKKNGEWRRWFVLSRTNKEVEIISNYLDDINVPNLTFKTGNIPPEEVEKKIQENSVKVLTIHTAKGMESDNVIVVGAKYYNDEERRIAYVGATRAKNALFWCEPITYSYPSKKKKKQYDSWW